MKPDTRRSLGRDSVFSDTTTLSRVTGTPMLEKDDPCRPCVGLTGWCSSRWFSGDGEVAGDMGLMNDGVSLGCRAVTGVSLKGVGSSDGLITVPATQNVS